MLRVTSLEQVGRILALYDAVQVEKMPVGLFRMHLLERRDAWFLEVGDKGLVFFTAVVPGRDATVNVFFWDKKLDASRVEIIKSCVTTAIDVFTLDRVNAFVPSRVTALRNRLVDDVGFVQEGIIRRGWPGPPVDDLVFLGMLKEEQPCLAVPLPTISLA